MNFFRTIIILAVLTVTTTCFGQKALLKQANKLYDAEKYDDAVTLFSKYDKIDKDKKARFRRAVAAYKSGKPQMAIADFNTAFELGKNDPVAFYYTAKSYVQLAAYDDAVVFFKNYLKRGKDKQLIQDAKDEILRCANAQKLIYRDQLAYAENLGPSVNTKYNEVKPLISPNNVNKFYFSSDRDISSGGLRNKKGIKDDLYGKFAFDLYAVELSNGNWTSVYPFNSLQNTAENEILESFSRDGSVMIYRKSFDLNRANFFVDTFSNDAEQRMFPSQVSEPMNGYRGDKDLFVFNDSTYLFSSNALDGYGGYDLYVVTQSNGTWQEPRNLGPKVNSKYDDTAPFLTAGGSKLLFCSNRLESLGGFDVFVSTYVKQESEWLLPANLGTPINSSGNETGVFVSRDGNQALVASDRIDGLGGSDLYLMYLKEQVTDQLKYTEELAFLAAKEVMPTEEGQIKEDVTLSDKAPTAPIKERDFVSNDLFFITEQDILSPTNLVYLKNLVELDKIIPGLQYRISAHSMMENSRSNSLFFSVKRAERVRDHLTSAGIAKSRIVVEGFGTSAPLVNSALGNAKRFNNRIEIDITNAAENRINITRKQGNLNESIKLESYREFEAMQSGLSYTILLTSTNQMFKSAMLEENIRSQVIKSKGQYDYYIGMYNKYQQARLAKLNLQQAGILNASIHTFINGKPIADEDLSKYADQYPDLKDYLRYK